ncbi:capZ-interacting protein isoform X1 [Oreochromis niloticus]|uniref:Zgc:153184 n=1 Tax=Oreochromis niloticus TaxID=8128 RepID=A0A669DXC6_ORENI|nr:capZ-interacting protein isoform X1 [Oreochromis niloticus]
MEKNSPSKPSVAELAGKFKGHILPMPNSNDEPRRRPPCSLKLQNQTDDNDESHKSAVPPNPIKVKVKNSAVIEKLQANLALSPTALLPSPKTPEVKLPQAPLSPTMPCSRLSPLTPTLQPSHQSSEEEEPISFDSPPEGTPLPSINKTRARLSFKRRLPTRQHRRSAGEEAEGFGSGLSPCELCSPKENGVKNQVLDSPSEEAECSLTEAENKEGDCETANAEMTKSDHDNREDMEHEAEQDRSSDASKEEQLASEPAEQKEGDIKAEERQEETPQEADQGGK